MKKVAFYLFRGLFLSPHVLLKVDVAICWQLDKDADGARGDTAKKVSFGRRAKKCSTLLPVNNFGFNGLGFDERDPFSSVSQDFSIGEISKYTYSKIALAFPHHQVTDEDGDALMPDKALLYLQMELCENTLRDWLDVRNSSSSCGWDAVDLAKNIVIFGQILSGVEYIHSQVSKGNFFLFCQ